MTSSKFLVVGSKNFPLQFLLTFFTQLMADYSLFTKIRGNFFIAILLYVDDMIITRNDEKMISDLKWFLSSHFRLNDLWHLKSFLGVEVARSKACNSIFQWKYTPDILEDAGLLGVKHVKFLMEQNLKLTLTDGDLLKDPTHYHRLVGKLIYLTITKLEITYYMSTFNQFMQQLRKPHPDAAHRLLWYLKGALGKCLFFPSHGKLKLVSYYDVDWTRSSTTQRSITVYCIFLGKIIVSWKSKKQSTVSRSWAEAEYRAMAATTSKLTWLRCLLQDLCAEHQNQQDYFCDSQAAIYIATNSIYHERTYHIELDCHTVCE